MKYIVELSIPKLLEVEAKSEDEAIRIVRQQLDNKQKYIADIRVAKEVKISYKWEGYFYIALFIFSWFLYLNIL